MVSNVHAKCSVCADVRPGRHLLYTATRKGQGYLPMSVHNSALYDLQMQVIPRSSLVEGTQVELHRSIQPRTQPPPPRVVTLRIPAQGASPTRKWLKLRALVKALRRQEVRKDKRGEGRKKQLWMDVEFAFIGAYLG